MIVIIKFVFRVLGFMGFGSFGVIHTPLLHLIFKKQFL